MDNINTSGYVDSTYIPFYHQKCPNCGYCPYCGRKDQPFKDHWQPPTDPYVDPFPKITWIAGSAAQATNPSSTYKVTLNADNFVTHDSNLR